MADPYTGDPNATQAPSSPPGPGVAPVVVLPEDADAFNSAAFYQAYKTLADFTAWLTEQPAITTFADTRKLWVAPQGMNSGSGEWVYQGTNPGEWLATAMSDDLYIPVPLYYLDGTRRQQITAVHARVKPNSTGLMAVQVYAADEMATMSAPAATPVGSPGSSDGTNDQQTITATVTVGPTDDKYIYVRVTAAQASDRVYGLRVDYDQSTI